MKQIKILIAALILFTPSCGYNSLLSDKNYSEPKINRIKIEGPIDLVFNLKSLLQIKETNNIEDPNVDIIISKKTTVEKKNEEGFSSRERIQISAEYKIYNKQGNTIVQDSVSSSKIYAISNSLSDDAEKVSLEQNNLLNQVAIEIRFKLSLALFEK